MPRRHAVLFLCVGFVTIALGCQERRTRAPERGRSVLTGTVRLAANAGLPEFEAFDLGRAPLIPEAPVAPPKPECADALTEARRAVRASAEGKLANVIVTASDFTRAKAALPHRPRRHRVALLGCTLEPQVVAAAAGDWLELHNETSVAYSPQLEPVARALPLEPGKDVLLPLKGGQVTSILCPPSLPCGRTDVVVFHHPVFAVTDDHGRFRIEGFPHGELVRVTAWHPLFDPSETYVWLEPGEQAAVDLSIEPKQRFAPGPSGRRN